MRMAVNVVDRCLWRVHPEGSVQKNPSVELPVCSAIDHDEFCRAFAVRGSTEIFRNKTPDRWPIPGDQARIRAASISDL
jgi:hypothetical protein